MKRGRETKNITSQIMFPAKARYIRDAVVFYEYAGNTLENRLKTKVRELCGTTENFHYEVHHMDELKNLKGK